MRNQFHHYNFCLSFYNTHHKTFELIFVRIKNEASANLSKKHATLGPRTVLPQLVLSSDQCSQRNFPNPHLVLFWSLIKIVFPQISALFWPISNSAPSISALFLLAQKERCPRTQCSAQFVSTQYLTKYHNLCR